MRWTKSRRSSYSTRILRLEATLSTPPTTSSCLSPRSLRKPDSCDVSQDGSSEAIIGEWVEQRGIRDQVVIATKVCPAYTVYQSC